MIKNSNGLLGSNHTHTHKCLHQHGRRKWAKTMRNYNGMQAIGPLQRYGTRTDQKFCYSVLVAVMHVFYFLTRPHWHGDVPWSVSDEKPLVPLVPVLHGRLLPWLLLLRRRRRGKVHDIATDLVCQIRLEIG